MNEIGEHGTGMTDQTKKALHTAIQKIAGTYGVDIVAIINCTVDAVNKTARTCDVTPISGKSTTPIKGVGLMPEKNDGELKIPSIGSTVGIAMSTLVDPYVISWSDLDEWHLTLGNTTVDVLSGSIQFGDGTFDGLVKVAALVTKINRLENTFNSHVHSGVTTGGGSSGPPASPIIPVTQQSDIENPNIKHGVT